MGDRSAKHARIPPTKEIFIAASRGTTLSARGLHHGYLIESDADIAQTELYVPHDYHGFFEAYLVLISYTALTPMTMNVQAQYGAINEIYNQNVQGALQKSINTGADTIHELDISDVINGDAAVAAIAAGDYVGVQVQRVSGQNTNALILGIRFRYKVFKYK